MQGCSLHGWMVVTQTLQTLAVHISAELKELYYTFGKQILWHTIQKKSYTLDFVRQKGGELSIFCHQNLENNTLCLLQFKTKHVQEIILITY